MSSLQLVVVIVIVFFALGIGFGAVAVVALSAVRTGGGRGHARRAARARRMAAFRAARQTSQPGGDWAGPGSGRGGWNDTIAAPYRGDGDDEAPEPGGGRQDAPPRWPGALSG